MFNEKKTEFSRKLKKDVPVWRTPKYEQSRAKAIEIMKKYKNISEGDFWILMNETGSGKMAYTGLIISHNACLKLNDQMQPGQRFNPECVTVDKAGYGGSLVFTYVCKEQGMYEVGEVKADNCKNSYPYAMAFKRCFDRVVLKLSKLAYDGVYSDSEAEEFAERFEDIEERAEACAGAVKRAEELATLIRRKGITVEAILHRFNVASLAEMSEADYTTCVNGLKKMEDRA